MIESLSSSPYEGYLMQCIQLYLYKHFIYESGQISQKNTAIYIIVIVH